MMLVVQVGSWWRSATVRQQPLTVIESGRSGVGEHLLGRGRSAGMHRLVFDNGLMGAELLENDPVNI